MNATAKHGIAARTLHINLDGNLNGCVFRSGDEWAIYVSRRHGTGVRRTDQFVAHLAGASARLQPDVVSAGSTNAVLRVGNAAIGMPARHIAKLQQLMGNALIDERPLTHRKSK